MALGLALTIIIFIVGVRLALDLEGGLGVMGGFGLKSIEGWFGELKRSVLEIGSVGVELGDLVVMEVVEVGVGRKW